jgi:NAD(P)-dependent dehydrogenase (short-subunit alcohol dehydrogenase family)
MTTSTLHQALAGQTVVVLGGSSGIGLETIIKRGRPVAAGFVDTPLSARILGDAIEQRREDLRATLPIRRVIGPSDLAALALHLMTNTAITGATLDIDGGRQLIPGLS